MLSKPNAYQVKEQQYNWRRPFLVGDCRAIDGSGCSHCKRKKNQTDLQEVCDYDFVNFLSCEEPRSYFSLSNSVAQDFSYFEVFLFLQTVAPFLLLVAAFLSPRARRVPYGEFTGALWETFQWAEEKGLRFSNLNIKLILASGVILNFIPWREVGIECSVNTCVYHEMYCEPTDHNSAFFRHMGNTCSNVVFTYCGLLMSWTNGLSILDSSYKHGFYTARLFDFLFGMCLLVSSVFSIIWHGTNCTRFYFHDVGVVYYVLIKQFNLMVSWMLRKHNPRVDQACLAVWLIIVYLRSNLYVVYQMRDDPWRRRDDAEVEYYMQSIFPLLFMLCPCLMIAIGVKAPLTSILIACGSLVIGWSFHLVDRFSLDIYCNPFAPAMFTNTCISNTLTGIALLLLCYHNRAWEVALDTFEHHGKKGQ